MGYQWPATLALELLPGCLPFALLCWGVIPIPPISPLGTDSSCHSYHHTTVVYCAAPPFVVPLFLAHHVVPECPFPMVGIQPLGVATLPAVY